MTKPTEKDREKARDVIERFMFDEQGFDPPETQNEKIAHASFISRIAQAIAEARDAERERIIHAVDGLNAIRNRDERFGMAQDEYDYVNRGDVLTAIRSE